MLRKSRSRSREHYQSVDMFIGSLIHLARVRLAISESRFCGGQNPDDALRTRIR